MYASVDLVRKVSGMTDEANVKSSIIRDKIMMGDSIINGALCKVYRMPIPYRRSCVVVFSGTGTGAGTLVVTVGGTAYNLTISTGTTKSQVADALRTALAARTDIFTDSYGSGEEVLIASVEKSNGDLVAATTAVTVLPITTAVGISGTVETILNRYPPALQQFSADYAAALLIADNYPVIGAADEGSTMDWKSRLEMMNSTLARLQGVQGKNDSALRILDELTYEELEMVAGDDPEFHPDAVSDVDFNDPTAPKVGINSQF